MKKTVYITGPVLMGKGIPLFGSTPNWIKVELIDSEILLGELVKSHYRVSKN